LLLPKGLRSTALRLQAIRRHLKPTCLTFFYLF